MNVKVVVSKTGTLSFSDGYIHLSQNREIFIIGKQIAKENIAGSFNIKLPEKFDIYGRDAASRKYVTEMLKKGKAIAAKAKKPAAKKKTRS